MTFSKYELNTLKSQTGLYY